MIPSDKTASCRFPSPNGFLTCSTLFDGDEMNCHTELVRKMECWRCVSVDMKEYVVVLRCTRVESNEFFC